MKFIPYNSFPYSHSHHSTILLKVIVIGLLDVKIGMPKFLYRGAGIGLMVSFTFYSSIGFGDLVHFIA